MSAPLLLITAMAATAASLPNEPVSTLDLNRYAGQWHEIAHLPLYFQRHCKDQITATYTIRGDGTIGVRNACRTADGKQKVAEATGKPAGGPAGALKVRFAPAWLSWLPWVWADYWVIELDPDYQWAVVGSPTLKYLWVLSRAPSMPRDQFQQIVERAKQRGYPMDRLVMAAPLD